MALAGRRMREEGWRAAEPGLGGHWAWTASGLSGDFRQLAPLQTCVGAGMLSYRPLVSL